MVLAKGKAKLSFETRMTIKYLWRVYGCELSAVLVLSLLYRTSRTKFSGPEICKVP